MTVTTSGLTRAAAAASVAAGLIFVAVQIGHPASDTFTTETTQWVVRGSAKLVMCALALAAVTGMYLRQHRRAGVLGLAGYLLFSVGYLALFGVELVATVVLPQLVDSRPGFVDDVVIAATGGQAVGDIGALSVLFGVAGAGYIVGGLVFGIALFRTGLLARWASALLAVSTVATAALAVLPEAFNRPFAVPEGIALVGLGVSLWRSAAEPTATVVAPRDVREPVTR
jgi:hypothetical protein